MLFRRHAATANCNADDKTHGRLPRRSFVILTVVMAAVVIHGSLYPYDFDVPANGAGAFRTLVMSWREPPSSFGDLVANILLYGPFGLFGAMAMRAAKRPLVVMSLMGLGLSTVMELVQYYDAGRVTNASDVYLNTFGTFLGAGVGGMLKARSRFPLLQVLSARPMPALLLAAMLGYHLFPYVPTIDLHKYWTSLKPLILTPSIAAYPLFRYFALWLTAGYLVAALAPRRPAAAVAAFVGFVFGCKIVITSLVLSGPEVVGAGLAFAALLVLSNRGKAAALFTAVVLASVVVCERLEPFMFQPATAGFGWMPFRSFMGGSLSVNVPSFAEKFFLYGSLVWVLDKAGLGRLYATSLAALLLFVTSYLEIYLPGRSAEVTDAAIALLAAAIMTALDGWSRRESDAVTGHEVQL